MDVTEAVITRTRRVPLPEVTPGDGSAVTRQLDVVLVSAGFKLSRNLFVNLSGRDTGQVLDIGVKVLAAVRRIAGDHVQHNPYFKNFPLNVPDTLEFWAGLMEEALFVNAGFYGAVTDGLMVDIGAGEMVEAGSLLSLPGYGKVQHSYEDMLAAHEALAASARDRMTLLHPGGTESEETSALYLELAGSNVPLAPEDLRLLEELAAVCVAGPQPDRVPVRENRAVINKVALANGCMLLADTVTDVLRAAAAASAGDVTLETPTKFRSFTRPERRTLMASLNRVTQNPVKFADVSQYAEEWKRLGERLHPHEYPQFPYAAGVFQVARREKRAPSITSMAETSFATGRTTMAARRLAHAPGLYFRSLDRLLRNADPAAVEVITSLAEEIAPQVSGRVLLGVREHLQNRHGKTGLPRVFANRNSRAWVTPDTRPGIDAGIRRHVMAMLDEVIASRLPQGGRLIIDPDALGVALPLSGKPAAPGLGVMPRGSVSAVVPGEQDVLTFFNYWKQAKHRTDYDLSALMTDREFSVTDWVSWQNFHSADAAATYSGDITSAPDGATEFVTFNLDKMRLPVIVPQILVYSGEEFSEAEESFCGYMLRGKDQRGNPFEPATVRMKSELRGSGRVAMPLAFIRGDDGQWRAKWLHFYLKGSPQFNVVQGHKVTTSLLTRAVIERDYLRVGYLTALMGKQTADGIALPARTPDDVARLVSDTPGPVTYIGLERPDGLPADATVITLANLTSVIPA